jgi:hypothetical protein
VSNNRRFPRSRQSTIPYPATLDLSFLGRDTLDPRITFTRASTGSYYNSAGVLSSAAVNEARLDYNPSTLAAQGLLIEESRTNLLLQSADFTTTWIPVSVTITANVLASPTGNVDADLVIDTSLSTEHYIEQNCSTTTNQAYTQTVYAKAGTAPSFRIMVVAVGSSNTTSLIIFTQTAGVFSAGSVAGLITSATATAVGNGWYRCAVTYTLNGTVTLHQMRLYPYLSGVYVGTGLGTYFFGAQLEVGSFPTSYIPTTTTALTRAADVASVNTLSPWYNAAEGTLYGEFLIPFAVTSGSTPRIACFLGAGGPNIDEIFLFVSQASGKAASGNVFTASVNAGRVDASASFAANTIIKSAYAVKPSDRAVTTAGATPSTSATAFTMPTVTSMGLGQAAAFFSLNGYLRRIVYYPVRLSNADLQAITT